MATDKHREEQSELQNRREQFQRHGTQRARWEPKNVRLARGIELQSHNDSFAIWKFLFKAIALPIWFPLHLRAKRKRSRKMRIVVDEFKQKGRGNDIKEMALMWIQNYPGECPLGEYDPAFSKLEGTFRQIVDGTKP